MSEIINGFKVFIKNGNNLFPAEYYFEGDPTNPDDEGMLVVTGKEKNNEKDENKDVDAEIKFLINNVSSAEEITAMYNKTNIRRRGYSTVMIAEMLGLETKKGSRYKSEKAIAKDIFEKLQTLK